MASTTGVSGVSGSQEALQYQRLLAARLNAAKTSLLGSGDQSSPTSASPFLRDADTQAAASSGTSSNPAAAGAAPGGMLSGALSGLLLQLQSLSGGDSGTAAAPPEASARTTADAAGPESAGTDKPAGRRPRGPEARAGTLNGSNLLVYAQLQGQSV